MTREDYAKPVETHPSTDIYEEIRRIMADQKSESSAGQSFTEVMYRRPEQHDPVDVVDEDESEDAKPVEPIPIPEESEPMESAQSVLEATVEMEEQSPPLPVTLPADQPDPVASEAPEPPVDAPVEPYPSGSYLTGMEPMEVKELPVPAEPVMSEAGETVVDAAVEPLPVEAEAIPSGELPVPSDAPDPDDDDEYVFPGDVEVRGEPEIPLPVEAPAPELPEMVGEYPRPDVPDQWSISEWQPPEGRSFEEPDADFQRELLAIGFAPIEPGPLPHTSESVDQGFDDARSIL